MQELRLVEGFRMSEEINEIFNKYQDVFLGKVEEIKDYLNKYLKKMFLRQEVLKVERIDSTDRISKSGFQKNVSSWKNTYNNVIVSTGMILDGEEKRFDYKFVFTEERLGEELVEKIEDVIKSSNILIKILEFDEALTNIDSTIDLIKDKNDRYYNNRLNEVRKKILDSKKEYEENCEKLEQLQQSFAENKNDENIEAALEQSKEIIELSKKTRKRDLQIEYQKEQEELETKLEERNRLKEDISELENQVIRAEQEGNHADAITQCKKIIELSQSLKDNEKEETYSSKLETLTRDLEKKEEIERKYSELKDQINTYKTNEEYQKALELCKEGEKLAKENENELELSSFTKIEEQLSKGIKDKQEQKEAAQIDEKINGLKNDIKEKRDNNDYEGAISSCDELLLLFNQVDRTDEKEEYSVIRNTIKEQMDLFSAKQQELDELEQTILRKKEDENYEEALSDCDNAITLSNELTKPEIAEKFLLLKDDIKKKRDEKNQLEEKESIEEDIKQLEEKLRHQQDSGDDQAALETCQSIIQLSRSIERQDLVETHEHTLTEIEKKIEERKKLEAQVIELEKKVIENKNAGQNDIALEKCKELIALGSSMNNSALIEKYTQESEFLKKTIEEEKAAEEKSLIEKEIADLSEFVKNARESKEYKSALFTCEEIIKKARSIDRGDIVEEHETIKQEIQQQVKKLEEKESKKEQALLEAQQIKEKYEEESQKKEAKQQELLKIAKEVEETMTFAANTIPLVEDFNTSDILGDISEDLDAALQQVGNLLFEHRVEVKKTIKNSAILTSASGEVEELESDIEVEELEEVEKKSSYQVSSGLINPFDDVIEEAIINDMIPYNFEISNIEVNGNRVDELPDKTFLNEGLELNWKFNDIAPREKVDIKYKLRRRISRTAIFILGNQVKIIKAHYDINDKNKPEGLHEAIIPFNNKYSEEINALVIEDIVPLYYINFIREPTEYLPEKPSLAETGQLIKWNVGTLEQGSMNYYYKLLELYLFEELKISIDELDKKGHGFLENGDIPKSIKEYEEILKLLNQFIN